MRRIWHRRLILLAIASVCILVAFLFARSQGLAYARRELESQLGKISGGPARVEGVELGWEQVVVRDVRLLDSSTGEPWVRIEQVVADVTFWDVISGNITPHEIVVDRGHLILRIDRDGNLLTQFPSLGPDRPLPCESIVLREASITLEQTDATPLHATQIDGRLQAKGANIEANATIGDALGTAWKLDATSDGRKQLTLTTAKLQLTGEELARLPNVPPALADIEQISAAVTIGLELAQAKHGTQDSRIEVTLESLQAHAPAADARLDNGSVRLVIEKQALHLDRLQGDFAGGRVSLAGVIRLATKTGKLNGSVEGIVLTELPAAWKAPTKVTGRITGETALNLEFSDKEVVLAGTTRGKIENAEVAGLAIEPLELELQLEPWHLGDTPSGTVHIGLGVSQLDVHEFLAKFEPTASEFAETTGGKLTGTLRLSVPLQAMADLTRYRGTGSLSSAQISAGELVIRDAETNILIDAGALSFNQFHCQLAGGSVRGQMMAQLDSGDVHADLTLEALSIGEFGKLTKTPVGDLQGDIAGEIALDGSWRKLAAIDAWTATGHLESAQIGLQDDAVTDPTTTFQLDKGVLRLDNLRAVWADSTITGSAVVDFQSPHAFSTDLSASELALAKLANRFPDLTDLQEVQGAAAITAKLNGTLQPLKLQAEGGVTLGSVSLEPWKFDRGDLRLCVEDESLHVTQFNVDAYGGTVHGAARVTLDGESFEAAGTFADITSDSLLPLPDPNFKVTGLASGDFSVTTSKTSKTLAARVALSGPTLSAHNVTVSELAGTASYDDGELKLQAKGRALDGVVSVEVAGEIPADRAETQLEGQLHAEGVALSALASATGYLPLQQLRGSANADIAFTIAGSELTPTGRGTISVERLRWKGTDVAPSATANITLSKDALVVQNFSARLSKGTARGEMMIPLAAGRSGTFRLNLQRVRSRQLLAFWPSLKDVADGDLDLRVDGRMDRTWNGSGQLRVSHAKIAGIAIQRLQVPMYWSFAPASNRVQIDANDATLHIGGGRIVSDLKLKFGRGLDIKCAGKVESVDLRALLNRGSGTSSGIDGALTANFSIEGRNVRSANDLIGTYDAKLVQSRSMLLPVFEDLASALGFGSLSSRFDTSEAHGRLAKGGLVSVEEMQLANSDVQIKIDGRVWLNGRIDLAVTAHTGDFGASTLLGQLLRSPLRFVQPVGIGLLIQANDFFSRRLLFFNIDGTVRNPIVRPRAAEFLNQEVVLFFLDEASSQLLR